MKLKKIKFNKEQKKYWSKSVLIFETHESSHEPETNYIKAKPQKILK
jgi:hypothetical protein